MHNDRYYRLCLDLVSLVLLFLSIPAHAYQNLAVATGANDFYFDAAKNQTFSRFSANDPIYDQATRTVTTTRPYNVTGLDGKTYQATITRTAAADIPKVGAALSKFAQRVGPLSMALATADLICSLSSICKSPDGQFEISGTDPLPGQPNSYPSSDGQWWGWGSLYYPDPQSACSNPDRITASIGSGFVFDHTVQLTTDTYACYVRKLSDGQIYPASNTYLKSGCASGYTASGSSCLKTGLTDNRSPSVSDWTNAETALSTPAAADRLVAELEPLPIQQPLSYSPLSVPLGSTTTTDKDSAGVATGTQTTTRRLQIDDAATLTEPNRAKVEEISTTTKYDINNQPISSTETASEPQTQPQTEPQKIDFPDYQAEFDTVTDTDLPTSEFSADFNPTSWGSSASCPPDLTTTVRGVNLVFRTAPICDAAETFRPLILVLASLSAAGIALGVRARGSD